MHKNAWKYWKMIATILTPIALVLTIAASIFVIQTAREIREVMVKTVPDLRFDVRLYLRHMGVKGEVIGPAWTSEDYCIFCYLEGEDIIDLSVEIKIINVGSGIAYNLSATLALPGLEYNPPTHEDWAKLWRGGESEVLPYSRLLGYFDFEITALSPQGGTESLEIRIPYRSIGALENLPKEYILEITDVDNRTFKKHKYLLLQRAILLKE